MGLDTSHDCFHGSYSEFMNWRRFLAKEIGIPLGMMKGFNDKYVTTEEVKSLEEKLGSERWNEPYHSCYQVLFAMRDIPGISWESMRRDPIVLLLDHSDCDGKIRWFNAKKIAHRLIQILRKMKNDTQKDMPARACYDGMFQCTKRFALGLLKAYRAREDVTFH